jgi:hypothetical protein
MYFCPFSRPAPKCVKIRRGDKILEDQPHNYEDDSEDDSDQVKYLPDNVTKYRYTPTFYFKYRRRFCMFLDGVLLLAVAVGTQFLVESIVLNSSVSWFRLRLLP